MRTEWSNFTFNNETSIINLYVNLAKDSTIRQKMATSAKLTSSILSAFNEKKNISELLALVINLMIGSSNFDTETVLAILKDHICSKNQLIHQRNGA